MSKVVGPPAVGTFTVGDVPNIGDRVRYDSEGRLYSGHSGQVVDIQVVVRLDNGVRISRTYTKFERI